MRDWGVSRGRPRTAEIPVAVEALAAGMKLFEPEDFEKREVFIPHLDLIRMNRGGGSALREVYRTHGIAIDLRRRVRGDAGVIPAQPYIERMEAGQLVITQWTRVPRRAS